MQTHPAKLFLTIVFMIYFGGIQQISCFAKNSVRYTQVIEKKKVRSNLSKIHRDKKKKNNAIEQKKDKSLQRKVNSKYKKKVKLSNLDKKMNLKEINKFQFRKSRTNKLPVYKVVK